MPVDAEKPAEWIDALVAAQRIIERFDNAGIIIGGVAVSLLSQPRLTQDVDALLVVPEERLEEVIAVAREVGLEPRIPDALEFARISRVLLFRHTGTGTDVDISLGALPFEYEAVSRASLVHLGDVSVRIPSPEDLVIMKTVAHRPKDMVDIGNIVEAYPHLDVVFVERWVRQFADALEEPAIYEDLKKLLPGRK